MTITIGIDTIIPTEHDENWTVETEAEYDAQRRGSNPLPPVTCGWCKRQYDAIYWRNDEVTQDWYLHADLRYCGLCGNLWRQDYCKCPLSYLKVFPDQEAVKVAKMIGGDKAVHAIEQALVGLEGPPEPQTE